jgi:putative nucleotidyltransferase with HDIG domain
MSSSLLRFLRAPTSDDYQQSQVARLLHVMLLVAAAATLSTGCLTLAVGWLAIAATLLVATALCVAGIAFGHQHRHDLSALTLCVAALGGILGAALLGEGLYDESVFALPIFVIAATFLFSRRSALWLATAAAITLLLTLYALQNRSAVHAVQIHPASLLRVVVLAVIVLTAAGVAWVVREGWDANLASLIESYESTIRGWARALDYKGGDIAGHSQRVTDLSVALAQRLGCSAEELDATRWGAYLHDVGKMAIPDRILLKPGPLDPDERRIIERHPLLGRSFIDDIPFLKSAAAVVYAHHERWDGGGYPEGLRGEEIPLVARVFTVADQWDALNSDRPYRNAWPKDDIVAYLHDNTGLIYDPRIVAALIELLDEDADRWVGLPAAAPELFAAAP